VTGVAALEPIQVAPSYQRAAKSIENAILTGRFALGQLLPTEGELATQLALNRSTVREALRSLEDTGLLVRTGGRRLMVSLPRADDIAWKASRALGLGKITFAELWEAQIALEPFAARVAAERIGKDVAEALRANIAYTQERLEDDDALIRLDIEFHHLVFEATANRALIHAAKPIGLLLYPATRRLYELVPQARHRLLKAHQTIARGLLAGDAARAESWMAKHIRDFRRGYDVAGLDTQAPISLDFMNRER
jgi:GntR family transcriptional repressor for pyruvate dehydrogenase complex